MTTPLVLNQDLLRARLFHGLKSLYSAADTLQPRFLEVAICQSFGFTHVGDSAYYADGIRGQQQLSVKTRMQNPELLKTSVGRDFQSHPAKFLGPHVNQKHNRWRAGLEVVQRRQQLDVENDSTADPLLIGQATLKGFQDNIDQSKAKYGVDQTYEVIAVHGYDRTQNFYLISLFWKEHTALTGQAVHWQREGSGVSGYTLHEGQQHKVFERINGNAKREATCFKEYKNLTKYPCSAEIAVPIPDPWHFDLTAILAEINLKETQRASLLS